MLAKINTISFEKLMILVIVLSMALFAISSVKPVQATYVGGINLGLFMNCSCGSGDLYLSDQGLLYVGPGTQYWAGDANSSFNVILDITEGAGVCVIDAGPYCYSITGANVNWWGGD